MFILLRVLKWEHVGTFVMIYDIDYSMIYDIDYSMFWNTTNIECKTNYDYLVHFSVHHY